jgi:quercetin dioxygenase-like cupin family protein
MMRALVNVMILGCILLISACGQQPGQETLPDKVLVSEAPFPVSDETIDLAQYPLYIDPQSGIPMAPLGTDSLFQVDATLVEIPPGGQLPPERHLLEEVIYIVSGEGHTNMWVHPDEQPQHYSWSAGDLLSPSLNTWHQHVNTSSDTTARFLSVTTAPLARNQFNNDEYIFSSGFVFEDRWHMGITQEAKYKGPNTMDMISGHFLSDVQGRKLQEVDGRRGLNLRPDVGDMAGNRLMEIFVREYLSNEMGVPSDGDRHPWEKIYLALEGEGTAVLKRNGEPARVVNWKKGDLFVVEANEHHDMGPRFGSTPVSPYPRLMQLKAPGYFDRIGDAGETRRTYVTADDRLIVE